MMKKILITLVLTTFSLTMMAQEKTKSFYDFVVTDINGEEFPLSQLVGKKVLVVNTASECGLTPQYAQLEELYKMYGGDQFTIIGFPANNFGGQEPGTDEEIKGFCEKNYGVSFPMMSKISVKGEDQHELYQWLTKKAMNGVSDTKVTWNFQKFMIDAKGNWVGAVAPQESPVSKEITDWVKAGRG